LLISRTTIYAMKPGKADSNPILSNVHTRVPYQVILMRLRLQCA
jgi:hypothetical protein